MSKPITLYSHATGPNPWKVAIILEELGLKSETKYMEMADLKKKPFEDLNINGRVPAIVDPNNNDFSLWESGAIVEYLIDRYDTKAALTYTSSPEKYLLQQWLHFQMSGQGPYFGQAAWFTYFHSEKNESARTRYVNEMKRVISVLNRHLEGRQYLVGNKCTYADLSFVTWQNMITFIMKDEVLDTAGDYPNYHAWNERLMARPAVKKVMAEKQQAMAGGK
ncbi:MAG: glutathione S- transferase, nitrogen catabolite repression regulator [Pycnora praestabilis]|nr:MAG: glutathione S- transferase, nitrogen catabolite repression regulator [Pycnora praestabilis]